jgi:hypothetical protein
LRAGFAGDAMALFNSSERRVAAALAELAFCNPFLPRRIDLEQKALGSAFVGRVPVMHRPTGLVLEEVFPNWQGLRIVSQRLATAARERLVEGCNAGEPDLRIYQDLALYYLFKKHLAEQGESELLTLHLHDTRALAKLWESFLGDFRFFLNPPCRDFTAEYEPAHAFACMFQIRRAFTGVFDYIVGASMAVAKLRAAVWESVFTHDLKRYGKALFSTLGRIPTLIAGPSGTGKELVASAIAVSRYVPFDPQTKRFEPVGNPFHPVNISALAPTLVESELFGHAKSSFTGALRDRKGRLEECGPLGSVFIDEIGEVDPEIQVKLLRVIQDRKFQRLGETTDRSFQGKIIAATNRDLAEEMQARRFREDLYYRLCGDIVTTPSLREQLEDLPEDLPNLVRYVVVRQLQITSAADCEALTEELVALIRESLPADYGWPGNFRELEQCLRNLLIHRDYRPLVGRRNRPLQGFLDKVKAGTLSSEDLLRHYYTLVYRREGNYRAAANILGVDWRTVRDKIDRTLPADELQ